jgi:hypothetical protein
LTTRDVANLSHRIASEEGRSEFELSHARLVQIEVGQSAPSIYKLFTLSAVYGTRVNDLLAYYVDLESPRRYHLQLGSVNTHVVDSVSAARLADDAPGSASPPVMSSPATASHATSSHTTLLSDLLHLWNCLPPSLLEQSGSRTRYGIIGTSDYTMYPLLRPGSLVQLEKPKGLLSARLCANEYERPLYFIEHRSGYVCSWCEIEHGRIVSIPHPLSPCRTRTFGYPQDAQILGMVTAVAIRLAQAPPAVREARPMAQGPAA